MGLLGPYRTYAASDVARRVGEDLLDHFAPYIVVRRRLGPEDLWYVVKVDEDLLRKLLAMRVSLARALELPEPGTRDVSRLHAAMGAENVSPATAMVLAPGAVPEVTSTTLSPTVLLDDHGVVRAVLRATALPPVQAALFPAVRPRDGIAGVEPGQVVEYCVTLNDTPPPGIGTPVRVRFPEGADTLTVHAEVSSREFEPDSSWFHAFTVDRELHSTPTEWCFRARPLGDKPTYTLTLTFIAAGAVAGYLKYTATRRASVATAAPPRSSSGGLALPSELGAPLMVSIAEQASSSHTITLYENGAQWAEPIAWAKETAEAFTLLENARSRASLRNIGYGLWVDLPAAAREFLDRSAGRGATTLFLSDGRVAPFEILQLHPARSGPFLGVDRPVARWVRDQEVLVADEVTVSAVACIRPNYEGGDALPIAAEEEQDLRKRFPDLSLFRSRADLDRMLRDDRFGLVHFAGHGVGMPPQISLEDGGVSPTAFHPSTPLLQARRPLFFLNACSVGAGTSVGLAIRSNFVKILLASHFSSVVAPMIEVDSAAARRAATVFYDALTESTIAEAVRRVRELASAAGVSEQSCASYMSYLAFAPATLKLKFQPVGRGPS